MKTRNLPTQSLETSAILAMAVILASLVQGERATAVGFAIGSILAMFSLWTFMVAVPRLFAARNPWAPLLLWILSAVKLPIYAMALMFAFSVLKVPPVAVFFGAALVPCILAAYGLNAGLATHPKKPHGAGTAR